MFHFLKLPEVPPPPPPDPLSESEEGEIKSPGPIDPILDTPDEIEKWRENRRRNFPCTKNILRKAEEDEHRRKRGDLSKMEIKIRKRMALTKFAFRKQNTPRGRNPFSKYHNLRGKLLKNEQLRANALSL